MVVALMKENSSRASSQIPPQPQRNNRLSDFAESENA
jgi:hypothetical protein